MVVLEEYWEDKTAGVGFVIFRSIWMAMEGVSATTITTTLVTKWAEIEQEGKRERHAASLFFEMSVSFFSVIFFSPLPVCLSDFLYPPCESAFLWLSYFFLHFLPVLQF